jgi:hypothetical protein
MTSIREIGQKSVNEWRLVVINHLTNSAVELRNDKRRVVDQDELRDSQQ